MEFGLSGAILIASSSLANGRQAGELVADQLRTDLRPASLEHVCDGSKTRSAPARELVPDMLASWIVRDRPHSITLSSSLAGRRPARELVRELVR